MNALDDCFELSLDEEIKFLTIWLTPTGSSTTSPGVEVGQVAAIYIETTFSRDVTFRSPVFSALPTRKLQHQYQRAPNERLTALSWIMNVSADLIRAVVSLDSDQTPCILVPEPTPPFDQIQKLYFETPNHDSHRELLLTSEAYFRDQAIVGLVFIYTSGTRVKVGDLETDVYQTIDFPQETRIVGLSVACRDGGLVNLEFEIEQTEQPRYKKLRFTSDPSHGPVVPGEYHWRDTWCKDKISAEDCPPLFPKDRTYQPPSESRLVGIYVGCQGLSCFGALYKPDALK